MSADLALLANDPTSLDVYDDPGKQIELACQRANAWLKAGIDVRIETIVETKAQAAALAAFAIQKQLGHDAELAALEVQRRAERGIGLAIRRGQETGEIATHGVGPTQPVTYTRNRLGKEETITVQPATRDPNLRSSDEFFTSGDDMTKTYAVTDGVTDEQFDDAIEEAKTEGNLSRANVVRKVKGEKNEKPTGEKRLELIRARAATGYTSSQIAAELGHNAETIRRFARDAGIDIPADRVMRGARRIDSTKVAAEIVATLESLALPLRTVNFTELDATQAEEWVNSLTESIRALNRFKQKIRELTQ